MEFTLQTTLIVATAAAAAINSGSFFAFSNFVMKALGELPPGDGARAMQEINRAAPNPLFVITLIGGGMAGAVLAATSPGAAGASWQVAGGLASVASALITMAFHVPRNNALERVDADSEQGRQTWLRYRVVWARGNHVRTLTSLASVLFLLQAVAA